MKRTSVLTFALILSIFYLIGLCLSESELKFNENVRIKRSPQGMPPMPPGMPPMPPGMPPMPSFEEAHGKRVVRQPPPPPPDSPPSKRVERQAESPPTPESPQSKRIARQATPEGPEGSPKRIVRQTKESKSILESFYARSKRAAKGTGSMPNKTG